MKTKKLAKAIKKICKHRGLDIKSLSLPEDVTIGEAYTSTYFDEYAQRRTMMNLIIEVEKIEVTNN